MELNYWGGTECVGAEHDDGTQERVVRVVRDGSPVILRPKQLVFALGVSGYPNIPAFDGAGSFLGEQRHSSQHPGGGDWAGKKAVVIGSNNSAHDICPDLWEHGADVTMVQRRVEAAVVEPAGSRRAQPPAGRRRHPMLCHLMHLFPNPRSFPRSKVPTGPAQA